MIDGSRIVRSIQVEETVEYSLAEGEGCLIWPNGSLRFNTYRFRKITLNQVVYGSGEIKVTWYGSAVAHKSVYGGGQMLRIDSDHGLYGDGCFTDVEKLCEFVGWEYPGKAGN